MKEIITLISLSGFAFLTFLLTLVIGLIKNSKWLKMTALFAFFVLTGLVGWTGYKVVSKTHHKVSGIFRMRTGDEIYDALFGKRETDCVNILNYQDQVVPKIDYAIWLHFETCPKELERILSKHDFHSEKLSTDNRNEKIPFEETLDWFDPTTLGDTIMVYEYSTEDNRNIQTIWTNLDSTEVFVRDILD